MSMKFSMKKISIVTINSNKHTHTHTHTIDSVVKKTTLLSLFHLKNPAPAQCLSQHRFSPELTVQQRGCNVKNTAEHFSSFCHSHTDRRQ